MSGLNFSHQLSPLAVFIGAVIGIGLPLIASVGPVSQILSTSLTRNMDSDNGGMKDPPKVLLLLLLFDFLISSCSFVFIISFAYSSSFSLLFLIILYFLEL